MVIESYTITDAQNRAGFATITKTANAYFITVNIDRPVTRSFSSMARLKEYCRRNGITRTDGKDKPEPAKPVRTPLKQAKKAVRVKELPPARTPMTKAQHDARVKELRQKIRDMEKAKQKAPAGFEIR